ncbi:hypothetical protein SpCBS45565_g05529 [Spizellomyces sp. 'palustris']|nr:hypothetical protein SpCBS45565_g05529 [Spizellomyces sp. 'palustris']
MEYNCTDRTDVNRHSLVHSAANPVQTDLPPPPIVHGSKDLLDLYGLKYIFERHAKPYNPRLDVNVQSLDPTYTPYIAHLRGKPDTRPGRYIRDLFQHHIPPVEVKRIDKSALKAAFTFPPGPIPNVDTSLLGREAQPQNTNLDKVKSEHGFDKPQKRISLKLNFAAAPPPPPIKTEAGDDGRDKKKKKRRTEDGDSMGDKKPKKKKKLSPGFGHAPASPTDPSSDIDILN